MFKKFKNLNLLLAIFGSCVFALSEEDSLDKAAKFIKIIENNANNENEVELDPEEVATLIKEMVSLLKKDSESEEDFDPNLQIASNFKRAFPANLEVKVNTKAQAYMSDSSKDPMATAQGIVQLTLLSNFATDPKKRLDSMYFLGLLYFNLHYQEEELQIPYLYMSCKVLLEFYNTSLKKGYKNEIRIAKALIRAAYGAHKIGEKKISSDIVRVMEVRCSKYKPSDIEKIFLKQIR